MILRVLLTYISEPEIFLYILLSCSFGIARQATSLFTADSACDRYEPPEERLDALEFMIYDLLMVIQFQYQRANIPHRFDYRIVIRADIRIALTL